MSWEPACSMEVLAQRSRFLHEVRTFFRDKNFLEVQTSVLARYGVTDPSINNIEAEEGYLQSSPEFQMKRLLAAGSPSIFQICPAFRKDEVGRWHNPEFTILEWYHLGISERELMEEVSELVNLLLGISSYQTISFDDLLKQSFGIDSHSEDSEFHRTALDLGYQDTNMLGIIDFLVATAIGRLDNRRVFLNDYPSNQSALAKLKKVGGIAVAARFELIVDGVELANGYNELTDAVELEVRMEKDNNDRVRKGLPKRELDQEFIDAMRHGLPECSGVAIGLDRLFALALGLDDIRSVIAFPHQ